MTSLLIHVGLPKTATTTLQDHFFAKHTQINYLGKPFSDDLAEVERQILTLDSYRFDHRLPALRQIFLKEAAAFAEGDILISHEGFLRNTRYGGHDLGRTARRLRAVFGEALAPVGRLEIIICLRNQVDLILSHYLQFIKGSQRDFDRYLEEALQRPDSGFPASLFYDELLDFYAAELGGENLHVLLFEDLLRDKAGFVAGLSEILGVDTGQSLALLEGKHEKQKQKRDQAYLAGGGKGLAKRLNKVLAATISVSPRQRAAIESLYREDNTRLMARLGLRLEKAGYPMAQDPLPQGALKEDAS